MALRAATGRYRSMLNRLRDNHIRSFATSTTTASKTASKADAAPLYIVMGFVVLAGIFAIHTGKNQLIHHPGVAITKKRRGSMSEVDDPDPNVASGSKFVDKSWFRKLAHIQDQSTTVLDTATPNPYTRSRKAETLKSVGVETRRH